MSALYQKGDLDGAIPLAEQIVKMQRQVDPVLPQALVTSLENLGQVRLAQFRMVDAQLKDMPLDSPDLHAVIIKREKAGTGAESNFREALKLVTNNRIGPNSQTSSIKINLAWLLYNYSPPDAKTSFSFDKQQRDRFDSEAKTGFYKRIDEARALYQDAEKETTAAENGSSDQALSVMFDLAEFETATGDLEKASEHYEECIERTEKKYGKLTKNLVFPLGSYARVLAATGQDDAVFEAVSRIVRITGKSAQIPKTLLNVSLRSERAFQSYNAPSIEANSRSAERSADLLNRRGVVMSQTGDELSTVSGVTAASTLGKNYYSPIGDLRFRRIPVRVLIDESGKVIEAEGMTPNAEVKASVEKIVKTWTFRPFVRKGKASSMKGYVECIMVDEKFHD